MILTEAEKLGLVAMMAGFSDEALIRSTLAESCNEVAGMWMQMPTEAQEEVKASAKIGVNNFLTMCDQIK